MRMPVGFFKIIFLIGYIFSLLFIIEAFARYLFFNTKFLSRFYVNDSSWWRLNWIKNKKYDPKDITQHYSISQYDNKLGWTVRPNLRNHDAAGKGALLSTNSKGIRGTKEFSYYREENNKIRIMTVGDSFTFGEEVSDDSTYSYFIEKLIPNSEVINLGCQGYGHDQMLLRFKTEGQMYKPDIIILGFIGSDKERNILSFRDYWKPKFYLKNKQLKLADSFIPPVENTLESEIFRSKIIDLLRIFYSRFRYNFGIAQKEENRITTAILDEFIDSAKELDSTIIFVYLAEGADISTEKYSSYEDFFKSYCGQRKLAYSKFLCVNTRPEFRSQVIKGKRFRNGHFEGHYDTSGHLLIAEVVEKELINLNLVSIKSIKKN